MSGFDNSQPITDDEALKDVDTTEPKGTAAAPDSEAESAVEEKLGDATPGPR